MIKPVNSKFKLFVSVVKKILLVQDCSVVHHHEVQWNPNSLACVAGRLRGRNESKEQGK